MKEENMALNREIQEYARAVAEAVRDWCHRETVAGSTAELAIYRAPIDTIIASVPRPTAQHHDAPTCVGWWWARRKGKWEAVRVTGWGAGSQDRHVAMVERAGSFTGAVCDAWVGPLLPPDTTEPAPEVPEWSTCVLCGKQTERTEVACLDCQKYAVDLVRAPVAPPTPDIDPEEVGRALDVLVSGGETNFTALIAAAREWLREQPAPGVQREGGVTVGAPLTCMQRRTH